jgi:prephenate dehydratase
VTRLGYLGPAGTFGEQAALLHAPSAQLEPFPSHTAVVQAVRDGLIEEGIAAIENSLDGGVYETMDSLLASEAVSIAAELVVPVEQNLIAGPGTSLADIEVVISHPSALGQCKGFLESKLPRARPVASLSTAAAVEEAVKTPRAAAIGTRRAAEINGGVLLAEGIQDFKQNKTRFVVISRRDSPPTGADKTSLAVTVPHDRPGTLLGVLKELSERQINLTHIESRPSRQQLGIYVFLIEFDGHREDKLAAEALEAIRRQASFFRLLGSYPRYRDAAD